MNRYAIGLYEKAVPKVLSWQEKLVHAKSFGYDFLEISIDETEEKLSRLDWSAAKRRELASISADADLPIRSMCLSGHRKYPMGASDPAVRARSMEIMEKALDFACDLGIRIVQLAGYDVYYEPGTEETERHFRENLRKAADMAAARGVILGFETMETPFMDTVGKSMAYVDSIGSPYLGVYPDAGNLTNAAKLYSGDVLEDLELGRGHLVAMHLKETVPGRYREVPFLTGHVDFQAVIAKAWDLGVRQFVTEMWDTGSPDWGSDIRFAIGSMRSILDRQN